MTDIWKEIATAFPLFHCGNHLLTCDERETWHIWDVDMKGGRSGCTSSHNTTHSTPIQCSWGPFAVEKNLVCWDFDRLFSPNKKTQPMRYILYSGYKNIHILQIVFKPRYCPQGDSQGLVQSRFSSTQHMQKPEPKGGGGVQNKRNIESTLSNTWLPFAIDALTKKTKQNTKP